MNFYLSSYAFVVTKEVFYISVGQVIYDFLQGYY